MFQTILLLPLLFGGKFSGKYIILPKLEQKNCMRNSNKLTELKIKQSKPDYKQYKLTDGEGMYLRVYPNGSKYWQLKYRYDGKQKTLSFGVWPEVGLSEAREKRAEARKKIKQGIDPIGEKKILQQEAEKESKFRKESLKITFKKVFQEWINTKSSEWTGKYTKNVSGYMNMHVFPDLGDKPILEIRRDDVIGILMKLEEKGIHETCYRIRQKLEAIFVYAEIKGYFEGVNPARYLEKIISKPKQKSHNSIPIEELPEFILKVEASKGAPPSTVLAMKFIILTFVRTVELRFADWKEFDLNCKEPIWVIPAERMKMGRTHHVPLVKQTVSILKEIRKYSGPKGYVFPQLRNQQKAMSENTLLYFSNRLGYAGRHTIHGFRTIASTVLNESRKWHPDVIELQFSHQESNKVRKAYNRAEHLDERRKMMEWWADHIDSLMIQAYDKKRIA